MSFQVKPYDNEWTCRLTTKPTDVQGLAGKTFTKTVNLLARSLFALNDLIHFQLPVWRNRAYWRSVDSKTDEKIHSILIDEGFKQPLISWEDKFNVILDRSVPWVRGPTQKDSEAVIILNHSTIDSCNYDQIYVHGDYTRPIFQNGGSRDRANYHFLKEEEFPKSLNREDYVEKDKKGNEFIPWKKFPEVLKKSNKKRAIIVTEAYREKSENYGKKYDLFTDSPYDPHWRDIYDIYIMPDDEYDRFINAKEISKGLRNFLINGP